MEPFSKKFGYNRGGPIDRYYIENFLQENASCIKGRVLEIGDNEYTLRFGGAAVTKSDIFHVDDKNPKATFVGDICNAPHLPDNGFDCIVLTQTLQFIYGYMDALKTCYRVLRPGGTLLITVPGLSPVPYDLWGDYCLWAFNKASMVRIMSELFSPDQFKINSYGNILVATSFLYGVGLPEMKKEEMDYHDPHFQVIISAKATKPL
jgi:SAM-dependent methyltransferase